VAYIYGDRQQINLLPASIEDYISAGDPVRVYDAFVEQLDFEELGIVLDDSQVGAPGYDPKAMLKLLVYGYSYGTASSRDLERAAHHNLSFIWLLGGLRPDHKTISEFRRKNKGALAAVLRQCARLCIKLDLVAGNVLFVDGTKIRASASRRRTHDRSYYEKRLLEIDRHIDELLREAEGLDEAEEGSESKVAISRDLRGAEKLKDRIKGALEEMKPGGRKSVNLTDPDCAVMHSVQGSHAAYNVQSVVDDRCGLIVRAEAVGDHTDINQFARQIERANEVLGRACEVACADAGYANIEQLARIDGQGMRVIVPSKSQAGHKKEPPFAKGSFRYDRGGDCYYCPEGRVLKLNAVSKTTGRRDYLISEAGVCRDCRHYGVCTRAKRGRKVVRLAKEAVKERLERQYEEASSRAVYGRRQARVEHPFGHIKRNLKAAAFLLRGQSGAQAETSLWATCFNIRRLLTILGADALLQNLKVAAAL
jgi:transposase